MLANIEGFWNPLLAQFESMVTEGFIRPGLDLNLLVVDRVEDIIPAIEQALALAVPRVEAEVSAKF